MIRSWELEMVTAQAEVWLLENVGSWYALFVENGAGGAGSGW